jgi:hypothetical protein
MRQEQLTGYQVRPSNMVFAVYLVKADGTEIPVMEQFAVYTHGTFDRAQVVCDALNNGLLSHVVTAVHADRTRRASA